MLRGSTRSPSADAENALIKLLITGASGFIGRNLSEQLAERYEIHAPCSAELDLLDGATIQRYLCENRFDVIVHCATTRSNRWLGAPADLMERNCRMFFNVARNEAAFGKMIYFGSGAEYDCGCLPAQVKESYFDTRVPADPYGFSKYICSKYAEYSAKIVNLRLFAVFGKYEAWQVRFISNACARVVHGLPIVIRKNAVFDYLHVDDLAKITCWFVENQAKWGAYNACRGKGYELTSLAAMVADVSGVNPTIVVKNEGMAQEYTGDNSLLLRELNGYEFRDIRDCIGELYSWYTTSKHLIDPAQLRFNE